MNGFFSSYGFGRGTVPNLPITVVLSAVLHLALLLFLSYSPFLKMNSAGQPSFINVDLATLTDTAAATSPTPAAVSKTALSPAPKPEPEVKQAPPAPAKDEVVVKKSSVKKEPPKPAPLQKAVEEAKPAPHEEVKPTPPQVASVQREPKPAPVAPAVSEESGPISALEGARQGVDASSNYYIQNLVSQIRRRWRPPGTLRYDRAAKPVIVYFKVQKDGRITNISIETSSGRKDLDLSAERAVTETFSIAPLPPNLVQDDSLGVHFKFIPEPTGG